MATEEAEIFKQCYLAARVVETEDIDGTPQWRVDWSVLGMNTHSWTFTDETEARAAYTVLENFYLEALSKIQSQIVEIHDQELPAPDYDSSSPKMT